MVIVRTEPEGHKEGTGGGGYRLQPGNVFIMRVVKGATDLPRVSEISLHLWEFSRSMADLT